QTDGEVALSHFVQQGGGDTAASRTNRVTQSDSAAVYVDLVHVKAQFTVYSSSLSRECFVGLNQVEVSNGQTSALECLTGGLDGSDTHDRRVAANRTECTNLSQRL